MTLELKLPPPLIAVITATMIWLSRWCWPGGSLSVSALDWLKYGLTASALLLGTAALAHFWYADTTIHPHKPHESRVLVARGVYRLSRNPMYLSLLLLLMAWSLQVGHLLTPLWLILFIWYLTRYQILPEERILRDLFGDEFEDYCRKVRRWV